MANTPSKQTKPGDFLPATPPTHLSPAGEGGACLLPGADNKWRLLLPGEGATVSKLARGDTLGERGQAVGEQSQWEIRMGLLTGL